jgi:hypothetical protein
MPDTPQHPTIAEIAELNPEAIVLDDLDEAILGIITMHGSLPILMYSVKGIIAILLKRDEMTEEDAWEHFGFNIACLYAGEYTPMLIDDLSINQDVLEYSREQHH